MSPTCRPTAHRLLVPLSLLPAILSLGACERATSAPGRDGLLTALAREELPRTIAPRLSVPVAYRACSAHVPVGGTIARSECGPAPEGSPEVLESATAAAHAAETRLDAEALHASAVVDLIWADAGNEEDGSISRLVAATRLVNPSAPMLVDLAAAYLVRAERTQNPRDLMEAVESAERAIGIDRDNAAGLYNLALALDRLRLNGQAAAAWRRFLTVDSTSGWGIEAERRARELEVVHGVPAHPAATASPGELKAYASRAPQEARLWGWDRLLGDWGAAVLRGDGRRADHYLRAAGALGEALEARGGDATLADAVRSIHAHRGDAGATRVLARAHLRYAEGRSAYRAEDNVLAGERFASVLAARPPSRALERWARTARGATLVRVRQYGRAEAVLRPLVSEADSSRSAALAGTASAALGTALLRTGRYEPALDAFHAAVRRFEQAGETEYLAAAQYLTADAEFALGETNSAYVWMHRALATFGARRGSVWLHTLLAVAADEVTSDRLPRTALRIQNEGMMVAQRTDTTHLVEAHLKRAVLAAAAGDTATAEADIRLGELLVPRLPTERARNWFRTSLRLARGAASLRSDPRRAAAAIDSILDSPGGAGTAFRILKALVTRAEARLALGDVDGATADLRRATAVLDDQRDQVESAHFRASLADAATGVVDRLVMLSINAGKPEEGLEHLERGRASFSPARARKGHRTQVRLAAPPGHAAVEYALIGDTLLIWTITGPDVRLTRTTVDRARLAATIESVRASLEKRDGNVDATRELAELYDWLVRPVEGRLGPASRRLVLVPDGEITAVPFPALYDAARRRYLVQTRVLSVHASLADAAPGARPSAAAGGVLLVADPAFEPRAHPGLARLPGAEAEVAAIAASYQDRRVLAGKAATRPALEAGLRGAGMLHFAGHAVLDERRPDRSYLVLASSGQPDDPGRLAAAELESMDLRQVRLVVLSACQTLRSSGRRSGGFAGFAGALLDAGAGGVIGSGWRVDDQLTRRLMAEFHAEFRRAGDAPAALRAAQLALLQSDDPAFRSPAAWAGFTYAGN